MAGFLSGLGQFAENDSSAGLILDLFSRHNVIAAKCSVRGLSLAWYDGKGVAEILEPASLQVPE